MKKSRIIYFSILFISIFIVSAMYFSYAFFINKVEGSGKLNIVAGTLDYKIESKDLKDNKITVKAHEIEKVDLSITSLNSIKSLYELYYNTEDNNDIEIGYSIDSIDEVLGEIDSNSKKKVTVIIKNNSDSDKVINLGVQGGLINNNLILTKGKSLNNEINLCNYEAGKVFTFDYTGDSQLFTTLCEGNYQVELWGSQGGHYSDTYSGGKGGYTKGNIYLDQAENLYVYVGQTNECINGTPGYTITAYNGGGKAGTSEEWPNRNFCGGGGATDIRLTKGFWKDFDSLKSRIMVAGAGGGANFFLEDVYSAIGGAAGGLIGFNGYGFNKGSEVYSTGGTQNSILFGYGKPWGTSGVGSGYYGGNSDGWTGGAGGSSFISGHNGCDAIKEESTENSIIHTGQSIHYSNYLFYDTVMIDGEGYNWTVEKGNVVVGMPTHDGNSTMIGNSGNGYAKITYLGKSTNIDDLIEYKLESDDLDNNQITIAANTMKKVTVDVNSLSKISSNYELYYTTDNLTDLIVGYGDKNNETSGVIGTNSKKTVDIYIRNTSDQSKTINFDIKGNVQDKDIMLDETEKTINNLCTVNKIYNFDYIKNEENFVAPCTGKYKLEVWGAQGGSNINVIGGYGGYSVGNTILSKDEILYTNIGGSGLGSHEELNGIDYNMTLHLDGGYNGGGIGTAGICTNTRYAASGGGATHISKTSGLLSKLENSKDKILLVAGGGGGSFEMGESLSHGTYGNGSSAGGYEGNTAIFTNVTHTKTYYATGGTQTSGGIGGNSYIDSTVQYIGIFGQGVGLRTTGTCNELSGGGGGYYGGGLGSWAPGAGGSGYIGNTLLIDKVMYCYECDESEEESTKTISTNNVSDEAISQYAKEGNGYAKITYLGD